MKKIAMWAMISAFALSLVACAGAGGDEEKMRVKCPSCGYEFDVERYGR